MSLVIKFDIRLKNKTNILLSLHLIKICDHSSKPNGHDNIHVHILLVGLIPTLIKFKHFTFIIKSSSNIQPSTKFCSFTSQDRKINNSTQTQDTLANYFLNQNTNFILPSHLLIDI